MESETLFEQILSGKFKTEDPKTVRMNEDLIQKLIEIDNLNLLAANTYIPISIRKFCLSYLRRCKNLKTKALLFKIIEDITSEMRVAHFVTFVGGKVVENLNIETNWFTVLQPILKQACASYVYQPSTFHKALINASYNSSRPLPPPQPILIDFVSEVINVAMKLVLMTRTLDGKEESLLTEEDYAQFLSDDDSDVENEEILPSASDHSRVSSITRQSSSYGMEGLWDNESSTSMEHREKNDPTANNYSLSRQQSLPNVTSEWSQEWSINAATRGSNHSLQSWPLQTIHVSC